MIVLYAATGLALLVSLIADRRKTGKAMRIAGKRLINILPALLTMIVMVSCVLYFVPNRLIALSLGRRDKRVGVLLASVLGSITLMPGFIAFPLCGILRQNGVSFMVLSAFTTTLMMVGVLTFPIEKAYLGTRVTIARNIISFGIAMVVAIMTGVFFGEILQ